MSKAVDRPLLSSDAAMAAAGHRSARTNRGATESGLSRFESLLEFDRCGWIGVSICVLCGVDYRIGQSRKSFSRGRGVRNLSGLGRRTAPGNRTQNLEIK